MKITITLTTAEVRGIKTYLNEVDLPTDDATIANEIKNRLYQTLRDPREAISDHIFHAESDYEKGSKLTNSGNGLAVLIRLRCPN